MTETNNKVKIMTHSARFHMDDIFAVATLSLLMEKEGKEFTLTRTRDMEIVKTADYLVDYGGIYDPSINRFDHHQEGGAGKRENGIPYASFGLVWKHYGDVLTSSSAVTSKIDKALVQSIDAGDNGVTFLEVKIEGLQPIDLGFIKSIFYPTWKEDIENLDDIFLNLVTYAKFFLRRVIVSVGDQIEAENLVIKNYNDSVDKRIVVLDNGRYPWDEVLNGFPEVLYVIYQNMTDNTWSAKAVRLNPFGYELRKKFPESWAGKRDLELENVTGVEGAVFCHNNLFLAVNKTKEGAIKMAEIAVNS